MKKILVLILAVFGLILFAVPALAATKNCVKTATDSRIAAMKSATDAFKQTVQSAESQHKQGIKSSGSNKLKITQSNSAYKAATKKAVAELELERKVIDGSYKNEVVACRKAN